MSTVEQRIQLSLAFPVSFTRAALAADNPVLADAIRRLEPDRRHRVAVVVDDGAAAAWPGLERMVHAYAEVHGFELVGMRLVAGGEAAKSGLARVEELHAGMLAAHLDRQSILLAIGGGAVLDMAGFAAATFHRGVRLVRMPTTVLAQNDAAMGVKNGVNGAGIKNLIGCFAVPFAVVADFDFLSTLDPRDRRAGLAEAVKVAAIRDTVFFRWLDGHAPALAAFEDRATEAMIRRAAELHLEHIATGGDPFELGSARPLDFGHWSAHKLESLTAHRLRHGEAVAIGMAVDSLYAAEAGLLAAGDAEAVVGLLHRLGFALWDEALDRRAPDGGRAVLAGLEEFREHLGGRLTIAMLAGIGHAVDVTSVDLAAMERALAALKRRAAAP